MAHSNLHHYTDSIRFEYPKSIYAVEDCIKLSPAEKDNAPIVDFFAGSGTTLHAVNAALDLPQSIFHNGHINHLRIHKFMLDNPDLFGHFKYSRLTASPCFFITKTASLVLQGALFESTDKKNV